MTLFSTENLHHVLQFFSKRFLEISLIFTIFTCFRGPKLLHGIVFLLPAILMRFSTKNLRRSYPGSSSGTWLIFYSRIFFSKIYEKFPEKIIFLIHLVVAWDRSPDLKTFEMDPYSHSASTFKLISDFEWVAEFFFADPVCGIYYYIVNGGETFGKSSTPGEQCPLPGL